MRKVQKSESALLAIILAVVGGFLDAYTYYCRDKVFANAQTGNIVRVGITLATTEYKETIRYLIPIIAFTLGVILSIYLKNKYFSIVHWRQIVLMIEATIIIVVGFIPIHYNLNILSNVLISFLCAMQAESFRKVLGKPFSSTMCTGNLRTGVEYFYDALKNKNYEVLINTIQYLLIIIAFIFGAFLGILVSKELMEKAIFILLIPLFLAICFMFDTKDIV